MSIMYIRDATGNLVPVKTIQGATGPEGPQGIQGIQGIQGKPGEKGKDGVIFTPSISDGVLSWSNNGNLENPPDFDFSAISGSFNETDPTVPAWAKQPNKPTYTAAEVGAMPADAGAENEQVLHDVTLTETVSRIDINLEQDVYKHYAVLFYPKGNTEYQSTNSTVTCFQYFSFSKNRKAELSVNFGAVPRCGAAVFSFYSDFENLVFSDPSVSKLEFISVDEDVIRTGSVIKFAIISALANSLSAGTRVVLKGWDKK